MAMVRIAWVLVLVLVACHHDGRVQQAGKVASSEPAADADPLRFLPADSGVVSGWDLKVLRASALWAEYLPKLEASLGPQLAEIQRTCGFDPLRAIDSVMLGAPAASPNGVIVIRGLERERTTACLEAKILSDTTVTKDGGVLSLANKSGALNLVAFADQTTAVLVGSKQPSKQALQAALATGAPLRRSPELVALLETLPPDAFMWFVANGDSSVLDKFANGLPSRPLSVVATFQVAAGISLTMQLRMADAAQASALVDSLEPRLQETRSFAERADARADGAMITVKVELSAENIRTLVGMLGPLIDAVRSSP